MFKSKKVESSNELENVSKQTIFNLAIIKDARIKTQKIYNEMLKEQM